MAKPPSQPSPATTLDQVPRSVSGFLGVLGFIGSIWVSSPWDLAPGERALFCTLAGAVPMMIFDLLVLKVHRRPTTGLVQRVAPANGKRVAIKLAGMVVLFGLIAAAYGVFREYHGRFYGPFWHVLKMVGGPLAVLTVPYVAWVDRRMADPRDGYWHFGVWALGPLFGVKRSEADAEEVRKHARAWLVKAFFLPLMLVYFSQNLSSIANKFANPRPVDHFIAFYDLAWLGLYTIDVAFAAIGYGLTLRIFDSHTRSAEPTMMGWALCIICYQPMWGLFGRMYFQYDDGKSWGAWLATMPTLQAIWGCAIIGLTVVYVWATVTFGLRFSNLTHRGILTFGPYRFLRHPAYVSKNISWWLVTIPFIPTSGWAEALRACCALMLVNTIYALRAWTEERHLGMDEAYRDYQRKTPWIGRRIAGWLGRT